MLGRQQGQAQRGVIGAPPKTVSAGGRGGVAGKIEIVTSTFTVVEVIKLDRERQLKRADEDKIVAFFEKPYIHLVAADRTVCESARHLIWRFSTLKPKDAVHLASALAYAEKRTLDALFAWDSDFTKLNGKVSSKFPIVHPYEESPSLESWADSNPTEGQAGTISEDATAQAPPPDS